MKVKATTSFAGEICMAAGEVRDVHEDVVAPLLKCGYLEPVEAPAEPDQKPDETAEQEPEQETGETAEQEPEKPKRSRSKGGKNGGLTHETL